MATNTCEENDVLRLLRVMRDSCLVPGGDDEKQRHFVAGLGALIGADVAELLARNENHRVPRAEAEVRIDCQPAGEIVFSRKTGPAFSDRDIRLVRWLVAEYPWRAPATLAAKRFTRRERLVIDLLLESHSRKEIAKRLGITVNTVQGYIKAIYRRIGVHSHAELLRHYFISRARGESSRAEAGPLKRVAGAV